MTSFNLPDLGEGLQEAEIVAWHVGVGDNVVADQPLLSVETEKAVVEIPSPQSGRIAKLHGAPGEIVKIGAPLVEFEAAGQADAGTVVGKVRLHQWTPGLVQDRAGRPYRQAAQVRVGGGVERRQEGNGRSGMPWPGMRHASDPPQGPALKQFMLKKITLGVDVGNQDGYGSGTVLHQKPYGTELLIELSWRGRGDERHGIDPSKASIEIGWVTQARAIWIGVNGTLYTTTISLARLRLASPKTVDGQL